MPCCNYVNGGFCLKTKIMLYKSQKNKVLKKKEPTNLEITEGITLRELINNVFKEAESHELHKTGFEELTMPLLEAKTVKGTFQIRISLCHEGNIGGWIEPGSSRIVKKEGDVITEQDVKHK